MLMLTFKRLGTGYYVATTVTGANVSIRGTVRNEGRAAVPVARGPWYVSYGDKVGAVAVGKTLNDAKRKADKLFG